MEEYRYITLVEELALKEEAASWFHSKWGVPKENKETEYGCS